MGDVCGFSLFYVKVGCLGFHGPQTRDFVKFKKAKWTHSCVREQEQTLLRDERYGEILSDASIAFKCLCP